jgi:hypothetical protein
MNKIEKDYQKYNKLRILAEIKIKQGTIEQLEAELSLLQMQLEQA